LIVIAVVAVVGFVGWQKFAGNANSGKAVLGQPFATQTVNGLTVKLLSSDGQLHNGDNEVGIEFRNAAGELVDAGTVKFELDMTMPGMQMHSGGLVDRGATAGQYRTRIQPSMTGDWNAKLSFDGPAGKGQTTFSANVK